jgi:Domain of unknown function (DUF4349)
VTMSQRDALAELRAHRPAAPAEVRERVRLIAAAEPRRPRRFGFTWRRAVLVLAPALVVVVAGTIALRGAEQRERNLAGRALDTVERTKKTPPAVFRAATPHAAGTTLGGEAATPAAPNRNRIQDYDAYLRLRVRDGAAVSNATKRAQSIARQLGGYASLLSVSTGGREGEATIRLRVPIGRVQDAVAKLAALGTIVGEQVEIKDLTAQVNAVDRKIARLQRRLADLRAQEQTDDVKRRIESVTRQVERLQRGRRTTVKEASLATISVELTTREAVVAKKQHHDSRLDGAWRALGWIGIAALYAVIVGGPFLLLAALAWAGWRTARRRAEARLLEQV